MSEQKKKALCYGVAHGLKVRRITIEDLKTFIDKLSDSEKELSQIRATLLVNFGGMRKDVKNPILVYKEDSTYSMVINVLNHYIDEIDNN